MRYDRMMVGIALAAAVALGASGCAGKVRLTSAKMCTAHGGTYAAATKTCSYAASTKSAQATCEAHGGYYDTAADVCEFNP